MSKESSIILPTISSDLSGLPLPSGVRLTAYFEKLGCEDKSSTSYDPENLGLQGIRAQSIEYAKVALNKAITDFIQSLEPIECPRPNAIIDYSCKVTIEDWRDPSYDEIIHKFQTSVSGILVRIEGHDEKLLEEHGILASVDPNSSVA